MPAADEDEIEIDEPELGSDTEDDADLAEAPDGDLAEDVFDDDFVEEFADEDEDEDDDDAAAAPAGKAAAADDDEDDEDEPDPDDVEEDLDMILKDKLASGDDLEEEEEEDDDQKVVAPLITATEGDNVAPKRDNEWTCNGCFLIVSARQFGKKSTATCPSGVGDCPSLEML